MKKINYTHVYTGSEVNVNFLLALFDENNIRSIVKNPYKSGVISGFHGGEFNSVQILVDETQKVAAEKIIQENLSS